MKKIVAALIVASCPACATDFSARVTEEKEVMASPAGQLSDASLAPFIQSAMTACDPPGKPSNGQIGKFALVGYVKTTGELSSVEIEPAAPVSRCFAAKFVTAPLPTPPVTSHGMYPVVVEMTITE